MLCSTHSVTLRHRHTVMMCATCSPLQGGGGASPGDSFDTEKFIGGKLRHSCNFDAGPSNTGGEIFIRGKFCHTPNPWFLVDNVEFLGLALYLFRCAIGYFLPRPPNTL